MADINDEDAPAAEENPYARVPYDDHPDRCQGKTAHGQCRMFRLPGSDHCKMHDKGATARHAEASKLSQYRIAKYRNRIEQFAGHDKVLSLRDEIGVARMLLETKLNRFQDPNDLVVHSPAILAVLGKIEALVVQCKRLESGLGQYLDKEAIVKLADDLVTIISAHVPEDKRAAIADQILDKVAGAVAKEQA